MKIIYSEEKKAFKWMKAKRDRDIRKIKTKVNKRY